MASTYTTNITLEKQGTNENSGTWGSRLNTNFIDLVDEAVAGVASVAITGNTTLTIPDGTTANVRHAVLRFTGTLSANATITVPALENNWIMQNGTTGGYNLVVIPSGGTASVVVPNGETVIIYSNGTDCYRGLSALMDADGDTAVEVERTADVDTIYLKAAGVTVVDVTPTAMVVNNAGSSSIDFRVESLQYANFFFIDASDDSVSIGIPPPGTSGFINLCGTNSAATAVADIAVYSGANSASNRTEFLSEYNTAMTTSAKRVAALGTLGGLILVQGDDGGGNKFVDAVLAFGDGATAVTVSSAVVGTPATRTYTIATNQLKVQMGSGTYTIRCSSIVSLVA